MTSHDSSRDLREVVVAVDGTPGSAGAVRYAAAAAVAAGTWLPLVHVSPNYPPLILAWPMPLDTLRSVGLDILAKATASAVLAAPGIEVRTTLLAGSRRAEIERVAEDARVLVLGRETREGLDRVLLGSTIAGVAARSVVPVVVVPADWAAGSFRGRIDVGIKSSTHADELLSHTFALASRSQSRLVVTTAWALPDPYLDRLELRAHAADWVAEGTEALETVVAPWRERYPGVAVELRIVHGRPAAVLLATGTETDLLVLARPRRRLPPHDRLGAVARAVLASTHVPVELVPTGHGTAPLPPAERERESLMQ